MKKKLKLNKSEIFYYVNGEKLTGTHSRIFGNVSGIWGDVSRISGDVSDISGNVSGISGNLDECEITKEERERGIKIEELTDYEPRPS